jgi:SAM-dependent methyltransferase
MKKFKNHHLKNRNKPIDFLTNVPANVSYLSKKPNFKIKSKKINFYYNKKFHHIYINNTIHKDYYEDYLMTNSYSNQMQTLQAQQLNKLIKIYKEGSNTNNPKSLVEIGCGDGSFLKKAQSKISRTLGIEPSKSFALQAKINGCKVINGYVNSSYKITNFFFDIFVSRQVFEHLSDPLDVLKGIKQMLNPGAVGLIEVPNGGKSLRKGSFYDFFPDHLQYYSVNSLVAIASAAGFNVISCNEAFGGNYLELWIRNDDNKNIEKLIKNLKVEKKIITSNLLNKIKFLYSQKKKIMIFGCGAKTLSIFSSFDISISKYISCAIDSDPNKIGRYIPNTSIKILSLSQAKKKNPDAIIILALYYIDEIKHILKKIFVKKNNKNYVNIFTLKKNKIVEL